MLCSCAILWSLCLSNRLLFLTCSSPGGCANCRYAESRLGHTRGASAQISQMMNAEPVEAIFIELDAWCVGYLKQHKEAQHPSKEVCVPQDSSCCTGCNQDERAEPDILRAGAD